MESLPLHDVQARLPELIHSLTPGAEVVITEAEKPVARLVPIAEMAPQPVAGRGRGVLTILADDDEHLADFREYFP